MEAAATSMHAEDVLDNPLLYKESNRMLFGEAKKMPDELLAALKA